MSTRNSYSVLQKCLIPVFESNLRKHSKFFFLSHLLEIGAGAVKSISW